MMFVFSRFAAIVFCLLVQSAECWAGVVDGEESFKSSKESFKWTVIFSDRPLGFDFRMPEDPVDKKRYWDGELNRSVDVAAGKQTFIFEAQHVSKAHDDDGLTGDPVTLTWTMGLSPFFPATTGVASDVTKHHHFPEPHHFDIYGVSIDSVSNAHDPTHSYYQLTMQGKHVPEPSSLGVFGVLTGIMAAMRRYRRSRIQSQ
jgi:hypothetical protein